MSIATRNEERIEFIEKYGTGLMNLWEQDFFESTRFLIYQGRELSWKQQKKLIELKKSIEEKIG